MKIKYLLIVSILLANLAVLQGCNPDKGESVEYTGELQGVDRIDGWGFGDAELQLPKGTTWEGGVRVPAIFWGSNIKSGVINDIGSTLDIYSTFLSVSGIEQQKNMLVDGLDLSKTLFDRRY